MTPGQRIDPAPTAGRAAAVIERLKALRCLVAVTRTGSTMRASEVIHLSQPAVARAILELERHFAVPLFDRGPRGMAPTPPGERAARRVESLLEHLRAGAAEAFAHTVVKARRRADPWRFASAVSPASLRAFLAVAAAGSEAAAARTAGVSQPAIHRSLNALEDLCGGALLLQRSARGTRLTDGGEALLHRVKLAMAEARALESDLSAWRGEVRGRVVIGVLPLSVTLVLVPRAVASVMARHPEIEITVVDGTYEMLMRQLRSADVDVVLGALRAEPPVGVSQESLFKEDLVVIARPGHPCLGRKRLALADLAGWRWIVPLPGTPASAALIRSFASAGLPPPSNGLQATSAMFTRALVSSSDCLALASRGQALEDEAVGLVRIAPVALPSTQRDIGIALRDSVDPSPDLAALLRELRAVQIGTSTGDKKTA